MIIREEARSSPVIRRKRDAMRKTPMIFKESGYVIYDGAIGTMLQRLGLKPGDRPDVMNITAPDVVENVHRMYVEAGSELICTNTFGANAIALKPTGYSPREVITAAAAAAKRACAGNAKISLDIGPIGELVEPVGDMALTKVYELFKEQAIAGEDAGVDFAHVETMSDLREMETAIRAIIENTHLPVLATMTFDKNGFTYLGCTPEAFAEKASIPGVAAIGLNCSLEPSEMLQTAKRIAAVTDLPLIVKPNAGLPDGITGAYSIGPEEFARQMKPFADIGVQIIGGCCGTTPDYIRELKRVFNTDPR